MAKEKEEKRVINLRLPEQLAQFLETKCSTITLGITSGVEIIKDNNRENETGEETVYRVTDTLRRLEAIQQYSTMELRERFTPSEWMYFADSLNGTFTPTEYRFNAKMLIANIEDSNIFDNLAKKYDVDVSSFCDKIMGCTAAQVESIFNRVEMFWTNPVDLEGWSKF